MINKIINKGNKSLIIFFSGASKKKFDSLFEIKSFEDKFDIIEVICDFENTTFSKLISLINLKLKEEIKKYNHIYAICKSFGGIISLLSNINFNQYIFLASPVIIGNSSLLNIMDTDLSLLELEDIVFDVDDLKDKNIFIFQGTNDKEKFQNFSKNLSENLGININYMNTNHSFDNVKKELEKKIYKILLN